MQKPKTKHERKLAKYEEVIAKFSLKESSSITEGLTPVENRQVTDVAFIICFILFLLTILVMSIYGVAEGHLQMLAAPVDSDGRLCGISDNIDYPNLYYYNMEGDKKSTKYATCVKRCPDSDKFQFVSTDCMKTSRTPDCTIPYNKGYTTVTMFYYCVRKAESIEMIKKRDVYRDLELAAPAASICLALGFVFTSIYIYLMSRFATQLTYVLIAVCELIIICGFIACIYGAGVVQYPGGAWGGAVLFMLLFIGLNLILYCKWDDFKVAIAVIDAAADFAIATKRLVLVTFASFIVGFLFIVLWFFGFINIISLNDIRTVKNEDGNFEKELLWNDKTITLTVFMLFGFVWTVSFLREQNMFINMICTAQFYFTSNREKEGAASVKLAIKTTHLKHAGSVALGSFIHAVTMLLKAIAEKASDAS